MLATKVDLARQCETEMEEFIELLHYDTSSQRGNIKLLVLEEGKKAEYKLLSYDSLLDRTERLEGQNDVYISPNTFMGYKGDTSGIWQLRTLYVDLDIRKKLPEYGIDEVFEMLLDMARDGIIPEPTIITFTGGGLHVYWRIKDAPKQAFNFWQDIERKLIEKLKPLGADPAASDCARVLRVPGTRNSKYGLKCELWHVNKSARYTLSGIQEEYFPYEIKGNKTTKKKSKGKGKSPGKITRLLNPYTLQIARAKDLYKFVTLRNGNLEGLRNNILLDYCYFKGLTVEPEELRELALELNKKFYEPLSLSEVKTIIKKALKYVDQHKEDKTKGINSRNSTLIKKYEIAPEEMEQLKTIIDSKEKQRRNTISKREKRRGTDGLTDKQRQLLEQKKKAHELAAQGFTRNNIAKTLNVSLSTVKRWLKE